MSPEHQRVAIAELCGWFFSDRNWHMPNGANATADGGPDLPADYPNDLNAMHEAEIHAYKNITDFSLAEYEERLGEACVKSQLPTWSPVCATAAQRAEALLRTLNKWEESR